MNKSMYITYREFSDRFGLQYLPVVGISEWAVNEGLASMEDRLHINEEQAKELCISEAEFNDRAT